MNDERDEQKVSEFAEYDLLARFRERIGAPVEGEVWSGDDAAVVAAGADQILFTTDSMVEKVDFDFAYCDPADVGFKAVAINVSDIAAMGGTPGAAVATLQLDPNTPVSVVDGLLDGMLEASQRWSVRIVGGDLSRAPALSIGIALLGVPPESGVVTRGGARAGDAIGITGTPGLSGLGLALLKAEGRSARDRPEARAHLRPEARPAEGAALARAGATAMIDVSDGVAIDLYRLCRASDTGCNVRVGDLEAPKEAVLLGGEDFELLFTIPSESFATARAAVQELGTNCTQIGEVTDSGMMVDGESLESWKDKAWDHLRNQ
jgi:thiamine-monophosphate kinase